MWYSTTRGKVLKISDGGIGGIMRRNYNDKVTIAQANEWLWVFLD